MTPPQEAGSIGGLGILMDVPMEVRVQLGSCVLRVREILELGEGSVVELARAIDEPVDLLVNDAVVARGTIVAVDESFALRITEFAGAGD